MRWDREGDGRGESSAYTHARFHVSTGPQIVDLPVEPA